MYKSTNSKEIEKLQTEIAEYDKELRHTVDHIIRIHHTFYGPITVGNGPSPFAKALQDAKDYAVQLSVKHIAKEINKTPTISVKAKEVLFQSIGHD